MIKAFVGAGGKTTEIFRQAKSYRQAGKKVFICTSTHMLIEKDTILSDDADLIINTLNKTGCVMAGLEVKKGEKVSLGPLSKDTYIKVCKEADVVLIEADGSKCKPSKFLRDDEPVIYENVDEIVVIMNLSAIGKTAEKAMHRYELAGFPKEHIITAKTIQFLLDVYVKKLSTLYPDRKINLMIKGADIMYKKAVKALCKDGFDVNLIKKEWFAEKPVIFICGGGHVSLEVSRVAQNLDYDVIVMDPREEFANKERFPYAKRVICDEFDNLKQYTPENAYYIIVTRGHVDDFKCLKYILDMKYTYLGMIGSKNKIRKTFDLLREIGFDDEKLKTVHAPIGLPIKAVTPAEISISIMAEIIEFKNSITNSSVSSELLKTQEKGTLCIIIDKHGSVPRAEGSMMFVGKDKIIDSIGGGIIEAKAIEKTRSIHKCFIEDYYLDNKTSSQLGMVCGGHNRVLFIPVE